MKAITKTTFIGLCLLGTALTASAQLKLHHNGNMSLHNTDTTALSPMSLNCNGNSSYYVAYGGEKNGVICTTNKEYENGIAGKFECSGDYNATGISGTASTNTTSILTRRSIGVSGFATNSGYTYSYGVAGSFDGPLGAGIYGTSSTISYPDGLPTGKYAGYFYGTTKVVGDFYATGSIHGTVVLGNSSSSPDCQSVMSFTADRGFATGILSRLNAHTYYHPMKEGADDSQSLVSDTTDEQAMPNKPEPDIIGEQISKKQHYALSAEELEKVLPDLVYEDRDGSKKINYMEMVPLLVQCINELNARLSALDGGTGTGDSQSPMSTRSEASARQTTDIAKTIATQAILYQNSPNPFTAQTEIRFSLPEDAPQAYIYIFDMTGKMQKQIPVSPNQQSVTINGSGLAQGLPLQPGIYLYSLVVGGQEIDSKKMILSK